MTRTTRRIVEIRAAEGGADAQSFVAELARAYGRLFLRLGWKSRLVRERPSEAGHYEMAFEIEGRDASRMEAEAGGHRIQRVPPTERRGRVHTSTVTVAVVDPDVRGDDVYDRRTDADFDVVFFSGTGAGGQHRNIIAPLRDTIPP